MKTVFAWVFAPIVAALRGIAMAVLSMFGNPGSDVMLNPQPLPPGGGEPGGDVMLNPQPLPPRTR